MMDKQLHQSCHRLGEECSTTTTTETTTSNNNNNSTTTSVNGDLNGHHHHHHSLSDSAEIIVDQVQQQQNRHRNQSDDSSVGVESSVESSTLSSLTTTTSTTSMDSSSSSAATTATANNTVTDSMKRFNHSSQSNVVLSQDEQLSNNEWKQYQQMEVKQQQQLPVETVVDKNELTNNNSNTTTSTNTSTTTTTTSTTATTLLVDDLFIGQILSKICPSQFSEQWLNALREKYLASYRNFGSSHDSGGGTDDGGGGCGSGGEYRYQNSTNATLDHYGQKLFTSVILINGCGGGNSGSKHSSLSSSSMVSQVPVRDAGGYLMNISEILDSVGHYLKRKASLNGAAAGIATSTTTTTATSTSSCNGLLEVANSDVDLLLKDIRSYLATTTSSGSSVEHLSNNVSNNNNSNSNTRNSSNKLPSTTSSSSPSSSISSATIEECTDTTISTTIGDDSDTTTTTTTTDQCSNNTEGTAKQQKASSLFGSILFRLTKLLHNCIDSESTRVEFYRIFADIINNQKPTGLNISFAPQEACFMHEISLLVNSLANFDINSNQIMSDAANAVNNNNNTNNGQQQILNGSGGSGGGQFATSLSASMLAFSADPQSLKIPSEPFNNAPSGSTHYYQSVIDCADELASVSTSGYGRSRNESNSSNAANSSTVATTALLVNPLSNDSGHPSPTSPNMLASSAGPLAKFNTTSPSSSSPSLGPGTIGRLPPRAAVSTAISAAAADSMNSPLHSNFLNQQLADLVDFSDMPKMISPPMEGNKHNTSRITSQDLFGNVSGSSGFDSLASSLGSTNGISNSTVGDMMDPASGNGSNFFSDFNGGNSSNGMGCLFGSTDRGPTEEMFNDIIDTKPTTGFAISPIAQSSNGGNQCYSITMNGQHTDRMRHLSCGASISGFVGQDRSSFMHKSGSAGGFNQQISSNMTNGHNNQHQPNGSGSPHDSSGSPVPPVPLCERDLFYRLIISQLLFHGHRAIANQLAIAERIKADGSLLSPNDRLHTLVSTAIRREIDLLTVNPNSDGTMLGNSKDPSDFQSPVGIGPAGSLSNGRSSMLDESNSFAKNVYDRSTSQLGGYGSPLLRPSPMFSPQSNDDYGDVPLDNVHDAYVTNSPDIFYGNSNGTQGGGGGTPTRVNQLMTPHNKTIGNLTNGNAGLSLRSHSSQSLLLNNSGGSVTNGNGSATGCPGFLLNENAMKNINQLANKLNATGGGTTSETNGIHHSIGGGGVSSLGPVFGRSASAMSAIGGASSLTSPPNGHQLSRSPIPIGGGGGGVVVPGGPSKGVLSLVPGGPSHTTGNGKSHKVMQIRAKFGSLGTGNTQFSSPHGFCLGVNEEIVIADTNNHRICIYEKNGTFKQMFGTAGKDEGQLWYPRKITMISHSQVRGTLQNPYYVICDRGMERSRMQIFTRNGNFVRKIPIRYIDIVAGIAINAQGNIVTVDSVSPTIFIINETGELLEWHDCSDHMREPSDIAVYENDYYICDFKGHCVVVFNERGNCLRKIGIESLTSFPNGIDISENGNILVGDSHGNRFHVAIFNKEGKLLAEYECPYVKVSRCCGLKLTSEGYVVTLAKNNHHVLVLNTLYIH